MAVLVLCVAGLAAIGAQMRCFDAAREAARLAARGDAAAATAAAHSVAPPGAVLRIDRDGDFVVAVVSTRTRLPGLVVSAKAVAAIEATTRPGP